MMDERDLFERAFDRFPPPERAMDRLIKRRDRKRRNARIEAGLLAFVIAGASLVVLMRIFTTDTRPGTPTPVPTLSPSPAPTASPIHLSIVSLDGRTLREIPVVLPSHTAGMDLSPDGQTIVFASGRRIGTVGIDGGNIQFLHPLKGSPNYISNPAWSPDGSQIVFQAGQARVQSLFVMDSNGGRARGVLGGVGRNPSWSPNGARIAFTRCCNYRRINTIGVRGGSQVFVAMGRVRVSEVGPVWSPDGKQIAFALDGSHVGIVDASGTGRVRELPVPDVGRLAWSPDGSQIAIAQTCGGISLLDAATGGVREVLGCSDHPSLGPVWLPSGKALLVVRAAGA